MPDYVGSVSAGKYTGRIFIENTRDHGEKIVGHLVRRWRRVEEPERAEALGRA